MRRFLVLAFAVAATFSVLANNFIPVSAPTAEGVVAYRPAGPNGAARLSEQVVPTASAPIAHAPVALAPAQPDLTAFEPHAPVPTIESVRVAVAPAQSFVNAQAVRPSSSFVKQRLLALPAITVMPDALATITREHSVATSLDIAVAERLALAPDTVSIRSIASVNDSFAATHTVSRQMPSVASERESAEPDVARAETKFIPLVAGAANIFASFEALPLAKLPEIVPASVVLTANASTHTAGAVAEISTERVAFEADVPRQKPAAAMFVTAAYSAPDSIFHRARYVVEPYVPVSIDVLTASNNVHSTSGVDKEISEREPVDADSATVPEPALVATSTDSPSATFERARLVPKPAALVSADSLATTETHSIIGGEAVSTQREFDNVSAEAAPRQTSVPSFLTALAEVPSAIFQRIKLVAVPEAIVQTDALAVNNTDHAAGTSSAWFETERALAVPDAAKIAVAKEPVLISSQTGMNADILKPMSAGPLVDAPLLNENAIALNGSTGTPFDRMIDTPDVPEAVIKARPILISGNNDFSSDLLKPLNAAVNPFVKLDKAEVLSAIQKTDNYCDPNFVGAPIRFSQTVELKLDDLLRQLHQRFGVNFIVGKGVSDMPMNIKAGSIPWNVLLKSQLFISGVRARCIDQNTIELVENASLPNLQDMADVETRFIKLKFLQRTSGGTVDLAGRSQGGSGGQGGSQGGCGGSSQGGSTGGSSSGGSGGGQGGQQGETAGSRASSKFDKLITEIEKILGIRSMTASSSGGGQSTGGPQSEEKRTNRFVTQIPGRNILAIRATDEEFKLIDQIIVRADRPPFQVVIKGLVYSANQDLLRDIGLQTTITGGTADGRQGGGVFGHTLGTGTLFDFSAILGTFEFNVQAKALQQNGVISVKSRPFATVLDGLCTTLEVGRQLPIVIDSGLGGQGSVTFVDASNNLAVTPYVVDDDNGNPIAVTLELRLAANDVDSSVTARGVPAISKRSVQTQLLLAEDKTAILGGFTVDQDSRSVSKTPGLGDIPIIGELFKRRIRDTRINRLYFAISVSVIPFGEAIRPVDVPGATTDPPSITPEQKKRADNAEPKQVKGP
ncbi:MAG: hypothetical protein ABIR33_13685 [Pyrinomonadaceae bacterium]